MAIFLRQRLPRHAYATAFTACQHFPATGDFDAKIHDIREMPDELTRVRLRRAMPSLSARFRYMISRGVDAARPRESRLRSLCLYIIRHHFADELAHVAMSPPRRHGID